MSYYQYQRPIPAYVPLDSASTTLTVRQHPKHALFTPEQKEKGRKPVDPPPIVQMHVDERQPGSEYWLVNPFLFMIAILVDAKSEEHVGPNSIIGQNVSSLHKLKDTDNRDGGFFVFHDISVRRMGTFKLLFNLYDVNKNNGDVNMIACTLSDEFTVLSSKDFKGLSESTAISRSFSDQGVRLRLRKEQRSLQGGKRNFAQSPEPSTPSVQSTMYGSGPVNDQYSYGDPGFKRPRSDSDYGSPPFAGQYQPRHAVYGTNLSGSSQSWGTHQHDQQSMTSETSTRASGLGALSSVQSHPAWQRNMQMANYSNTVGQAAASGYYPNVCSAMNPQGMYGSSTYGEQTSLQQHPLRSTGEGYSTSTGLHTPSSMGDQTMGGSQYQSFIHSPQQMSHQHPELRNPIPQQSGRGGSIERSLSGYQNTAYPQALPSGAYDHTSLASSSAGARYEHTYTGTNPNAHGAYQQHGREPNQSSQIAQYPPNAGDMSHQMASSLDSGLLNTSFSRGYDSQTLARQQQQQQQQNQVQHPSDMIGPDEMLPNIKNESLPYPTPNASNWN